MGKLNKTRNLGTISIVLIAIALFMVALFWVLSWGDYLNGIGEDLVVYFLIGFLISFIGFVVELFELTFIIDLFRKRKTRR